MDSPYIKCDFQTKKKNGDTKRAVPASIENTSINTVCKVKQTKLQIHCMTDYAYQCILRCDHLNDQQIV